MATEKCKDESYEVTGKVCPPKMPMDNVTMENWQSLPPPFLDSLFTESAIEGSKIINSASLCALSSQASVVLSSDGLSHSSVTLPYYYCNFCDHNTASKLNLLKHIAEKHLFKCQMCDDFISFTRSGLIQHQLQKHVDAEEMQPVLCAKTVQFSTSELQRSIKHLKQFAHGQNGNAVNSSLPNSSLLKDSNTESAENNFLTCVGSSNDMSSMKNKNPDTTSMANLKKTDVNVFNNAGVESIFEEAKSKLRLDRDECIETVERNISGFTVTEGNRNGLNLKYPQEMPHFLNDSDSSVTSSRLTPPSVCKSSQDAPWHSEKNVTDVKHLIPSFLTETSPMTKRSENAKSTYMIQKLLKCSGEKENIKDQSMKDCMIENSSSSPSSSSSICKKILTATEKNGEAEKERSSSPNLTSLSVERLQKQLEDAVSNSPGFIFKASSSDPLHATEHLSEAHHTECTQKSTLHLPSSFRHRGADLHESIKPSESKMDNFLIDNEDPGSSQSTPTTLIRSNSDCRHDTAKKNQQPISAKLSLKGDNYDMLRNLLVQKPKEPVATNFCNINKASQLRLKCSKTAPPVCNDMSLISKVDSNMCWAKASDMSLKELLTGSVPRVNNVDAVKIDKDNSVPSLPIYLVCGFCNFESHSKAHFDCHMEICKNLHSCPKENLSTVHNTANTATQLVNLEKDIKQENEELENCISDACNSKSSEEFTASGLLKSLTDQCLGFNLKTQINDGNIHGKDSFPIPTFLNGTHSNGQSQLTLERSRDTISKSVSDMHSSNRNTTYLSATTHPKASSLSPNFIFSENVDRSKNDSSTSATRKRRNEDTDYIYESDQNVESENSSDSDSKINASKICMVKNASAGRNDYDMRSPTVKRPCKNSLSKQPNLYLSCLNCSFSTANRTDMRQHLITKHPSNVSFCKARFEFQKDSLLYFCCGVNASCTFFSIEGAEIFEHIKLCYSGHLDNFLDNKKPNFYNYTPVLYSLGIAAKKLNSSPSMFYCLTCSFSNSNFQRVAHHVSINHPDKVAGVLHINKTQPEALALMVCLSCTSHVLVKNWATHPCRKADPLSHNGIASFTSTTSKMFNRSAVLQGCTDQGKVSLLCELMAAEKGKIVECCSERAGKMKPEPGIKSSVMDALPCNLPESVQSNGGEELFIKQEILDVEDSSDVPVNDIDHGAFEINGKAEVNSNYTQAVKLNGFSNKDLNKSASHSRVLQTLLSTPNEGSAVPKNISLLQNLLCSTEVTKEKSDLSLISKSLSNSQVSPGLTIQSQYSTMLETLSRQASHSSHNTFTKPENLNEERRNSFSSANDSKKASALQKSDFLKPDSIIISGRKNSQNPSSHLQTSLTPTEGGHVSPQAFSRPPLLPLITPLSLSRSEENLSSHAPFSNLLRGLLCKVHPKPPHSQNGF